jgi:hypothetical protein
MKVVRKNTAKGHYYLDADTGERVPGVTTIGGNGLPKPALLNWAGEATAEYAVDNWDTLAALPLTERLKKIKGGRYEKRDAAANKGTAVHAMAERLIAGEKVTVPDELTGYVDACVAFLDNFDVRAVHVEAVVYSETNRHVGTCDLIADVLLPDMPEYDHIGRDAEGYSRGLLDWKTAEVRHLRRGRPAAGRLPALRVPDHRGRRGRRHARGRLLRGHPPAPKRLQLRAADLRRRRVPGLPVRQGNRPDRRRPARSGRRPIVPPTASQYVLTKAADEEVPY